MTNYELFIWIDPLLVSDDLFEIYMNKINKHNSSVLAWELNDIPCDAGFDLIVPSDITVNRISWANKINHGIKATMKYKGKSSSYHLYSRSSTPIKTPLRLSNSVGIIDSGYTGYIIGLFDNIQQRSEFTISKGDRLLQICSPNITYPFKIKLIENESNLIKSHRGTGGFGSTDDHIIA